MPANSVVRARFDARTKGGSLRDAEENRAHRVRCLSPAAGARRGELFKVGKPDKFPPADTPLPRRNLDHRLSGEWTTTATATSSQIWF